MTPIGSSPLIGSSENEQLWLGQQRRTDPQALPHAHRVLADGAVGACAQPNAFEDRGHAAVGNAAQGRKGQQILSSAQLLVERWSIDERTDAAQEAGGFVERLSEHGSRAAVRSCEAEQHAHRC